MNIVRRVTGNLLCAGGLLTYGLLAAFIGNNIDKAGGVNIIKANAVNSLISATSICAGACIIAGAILIFSSIKKQNI